MARSANTLGGQLVQATDQYLAVRNARIVLCDDTGLRAATTTMWLRGMGDMMLAFLRKTCPGHRASKVNYTVATIIDAPLVSPEGAFGRVSNGAILVDASRSQDYRSGHARASIWITRSRVTTLDCRLNDTIIVTGQEKSLILGVVSDFLELGFTNMFWFEGSPEIWSRAGFEIEQTPDCPTDQECIDFLFFVHDRHDGNMDAARRYLEWENRFVSSTRRSRTWHFTATAVKFDAVDQKFQSFDKYEKNLYQE